MEGTGEFVDGQALAPEGTWVRYDGEGRPPITAGPFAETKDLIAGSMVVDVDSHERALQLAGELSAAPGAGEIDPQSWLGPGHHVRDVGNLSRRASVTSGSARLDPM